MNTPPTLHPVIKLINLLPILQHAILHFLRNLLKRLRYVSILSLPSQNDGNLGSFALISQDASFGSNFLSAFI